ncbi:MAG: hypothetical protein AB8B83_05500 [Bdellovibrionales bacterium]
MNVIELQSKTYVSMGTSIQYYDFFIDGKSLLDILQCDYNNIASSFCSYAPKEYSKRIARELLLEVKPESGDKRVTLYHGELYSETKGSKILEHEPLTATVTGNRKYFEWSDFKEEVDYEQYDLPPLRFDRQQYHHTFKRFTE